MFTDSVTMCIVASLAMLLAYWTSQNIRWWDGLDASSRFSGKSNREWVHHAPYVNHFLLPGTFNWSAAPVHRPPLDEVSRFDVKEVSATSLFWQAYIRGQPAVVTGFQNLEKLAAVVTGRKNNEMFLNFLRKNYGSMKCPLTIGKVIQKNETHDQVGPYGKVGTNLQHHWHHCAFCSLDLL